MTRRDWLGAAIIVPYYAATVLGHLEFSLWLVKRRTSDLFGVFKFADFLPPAALLAALAIAIWQFRRAAAGSRRLATIAAWAIWLLPAIAYDRLLTFSFAETIHYPQYALLAMLLARFTDPERTHFVFGPILLSLTVLGIADEALQYTWITVSYSHYFDFNDIVLNLLAGIGGLLLYYGFPRQPAVEPERREWRRALVGLAVLGLVLASFVLGIRAYDQRRPMPLIEREVSYGAWIPGPHTGRYYVLPPLPGTLLLISLAALGSAAPLLFRSSSTANHAARSY